MTETPRQKRVLHITPVILRQALKDTQPSECAEQSWIREESEHDCPACGGSGHKDDAAAQPSGWQPIETAPKDGTRVLGFVEGECVCVMIYCKTPHVPLYGWHFTEGDPEDWDMVKPTHWMPLPPAPGEDTQPSERATPRVKALEFELYAEGEPDHSVAETIVGEYVLTTTPAGRWRAYLGDLDLGVFDTLEQAQAACQEDYERRVLSALEVG